jgi:hypothetical protein
MLLGLQTRRSARSSSRAPPASHKKRPRKNAEIVPLPFVSAVDQGEQRCWNSWSTSKN